MNIVSGEQFQSLCEIGFCTEKNCIIEDQNNSLKQNIHKISDFDQQNIGKYKKIFIYGDFIHDFMDKFLDHLSDNTIIVTHNSDNGIYEEHKKYLDSKKISKWVIPDRYYISFPYGIFDLKVVRKARKKISNRNRFYLSHKLNVFFHEDRSQIHYK